MYGKCWRVKLKVIRVESLKKAHFLKNLWNDTKVIHMVEDSHKKQNEKQMRVLHDIEDHLYLPVHNATTAT